MVLSTEELKDIVKNSNSLRATLRAIGLSLQPPYFKALKHRILEEKIDFSHFRRECIKKWGNSEIFKENSQVSRNCAKGRILKEGLLKNCCSECGLSDTWNGKNIVLVLDHINGTNNDNRIENLRFLCPNCNSQQTTFSGRNAKESIFTNRKSSEDIVLRKAFRNKRREFRRNNPSIGFPSELKTEKEKLNLHKDVMLLKRKAVRPSKEELSAMVVEKSVSAIARDHKVSDNAVRKWFKSYGIENLLPTRGFWLKK